MKRRLIAWAARLYPSAWRERYGEEFAVLVDDMHTAGWAAVWDVWKGAMLMQVKYRWEVIRLAAVFGLVGLVSAWAVSLGIPDVYMSEVTVHAENVGPDSLRQTLRRVLSRRQLHQLIEKHHLYAADRLRLPLEEVVEKMGKSVAIAGVLGKDAGKSDFTIGFSYPDPALAQHVTRDLVAGLMEENLRARNRGVLVVRDLPSHPDPLYPNRLVAAFTGLLCGSLFGTAWAVLKRRSS